MCLHCEQEKEDTVERENPYIAEIHGKYIIQPICDDCYEELLGAI